MTSGGDAQGGEHEGRDLRALHGGEGSGEIEDRELARELRPDDGAVMVDIGRDAGGSRGQAKASTLHGRGVLRAGVELDHRVDAEAAHEQAAAFAHRRAAREQALAPAGRAARAADRR